MALILSAPIITTFLYRPLSIKDAPVVSANKKPLQAALKSKPQAFIAPILSQIILAVAGKTISGVTVAQIMQSISVGSMPLFLHISSTAGTAISDVASPSPFKIRLSSIPVLDFIHSSLVSIMVSKIALVNLNSGT